MSWPSVSSRRLIFREHCSSLCPSRLMASVLEIKSPSRRLVVLAGKKGVRRAAEQRRLGDPVLESLPCRVTLIDPCPPPWYLRSRPGSLAMRALVAGTILCACTEYTRESSGSCHLPLCRDRTTPPRWHRLLNPEAGIRTVLGCLLTQRTCGRRWGQYTP